jgi:hypothetical protein
VIHRATPLWRSRQRKLARLSRLAEQRGEQPTQASLRGVTESGVDETALVVYNTACDKLEELGYSVEERSAELDIVLVEDGSPYDGNFWVARACSFLGPCLARYA